MPIYKESILSFLESILFFLSIYSRVKIIIHHSKTNIIINIISCTCNICIILLNNFYIRNQYLQKYQDKKKCNRRHIRTIYPMV